MNFPKPSCHEEARNFFFATVHGRGVRVQESTLPTRINPTKLLSIMKQRLLLFCKTNFGCKSVKYLWDILHPCVFYLIIMPSIGTFNNLAMSLWVKTYDYLPPSQPTPCSSHYTYTIIASLALAPIHQLLFHKIGIKGSCASSTERDRPAAIERATEWRERQKNPTITTTEVYILYFVTKKIVKVDQKIMIWH